MNGVLAESPERPLLPALGEITTRSRLLGARKLPLAGRGVSQGFDLGLAAPRAVSGHCCCSEPSRPRRFAIAAGTDSHTHRAVRRRRDVLGREGWGPSRATLNPRPGREQLVQGT